MRALVVGAARLQLLRVVQRLQRMAQDVEHPFAQCRGVVEHPGGHRALAVGIGERGEFAQDPLRGTVEYAGTGQAQHPPGQVPDVLLPQDVDDLVEGRAESLVPAELRMDCSPKGIQVGHPDVVAVRE
jgi:hypothetical protein